MPKNQENSKTDEAKKKRLDWAQVFGLYSYLLPYKKVFFPSLVALFLTAGLSLAFPYFLGSLIGSPAEAMRGDSEIDAGAVGGRIDSVVKWLLGILLLQAFISYWRVRGFIKAGEGALRDLRADVFGRLVRLPVGWFMERRTGEVSGRVAGDLGILRDTLLTTVPQLARQLVILIGGLVFVFISSVKLSLFMLAVIPVVVLAVAFFGRKIRGFSTEAQDRLAESNVVVEEAVQGIMDVKAFTNESFEEERYGKSLDRFLKVTMDGAKARAAFVSFIIFVLFGTISLVVWFGAGMLVRGELTGEEFARFILFSVFVGASLGAFPEIISQLQKTAGATERVKEILYEEPEVVADASAEEPAPATISGGLKVEGVEFSYPSRPEVSVLNGLSFEVKAGERVAIVGSSGGGKSTLFSLLLGFYQPKAGSLVFDGNGELTIKQIRQAMAVVPQEVLLFGGSILENIQYGETGASLEEVKEAARRANAHDFIEAFPDSYETLVGPRGVKLSGGQRQRVAIARAILADPKILLLDEATSALDSENERLVQGALDELMQERTSLIIAHRLATVREADRILVLHGGKIAEAGTHDELMQKDGLYRVLAETQLMQS